MPDVLIAGGGSGGHVAPAIAVAEALAEKDCEVIIAHSTRLIDKRMIQETSFTSESLKSTPLVASPIGFIKFCYGFLSAASQTKALIRQYNIRCVVATGGFVAGPALWAASRMGIPTILLNFDKPPGKANTLACRWATSVLSTVDWEEVNARRVPPPLRKCTISRDDQRTSILDLGLDPSKMTLLVTGASQGAGTINALVPQLALNTPRVFSNWQILHLAGTNKVKEVEMAYKQTKVSHIVLDFTDEMGKAWGAADLAITRGGANTIAEIAINAVPSVVMPYPYHKDDHQLTNTKPLEEIGGVVIETDYKSLETNIEHAGQRILQLLTNHRRRFEMHQALSLKTPINGASVIADAAINIIN